MELVTATRIKRFCPLPLSASDNSLVSPVFGLTLRMAPCSELRLSEDYAGAGGESTQQRANSGPVFQQSGSALTGIELSYVDYGQ